MKRKRAPQPQLPAVALLIETSNAYCRELLQGIRDYLRAHGEWAVHLTELGRSGEAPWFASWQGDGVIARVDNAVIEKAVRSKGVPVVNVSGAELAPEFPAVIADGAGLARLAAEHLLQRGFHHFGFCGDCRFAWARDYSRHFVAAVQRAGHQCAVFDSQPADALNWNRERRKLARWLTALPKPVGIMASYDIRGQHVLEVCRELGLQVPDEVAVIGQHNDELLCAFCQPPLSSVMPNARQAGYEAARLLDRMMRGQRVSPKPLKIPPLGVIARQSTDAIAVPDPQLAAAVRYIREHASEGIGVQEVLKAVPMSRTAFERKFRDHFGGSPYSEILKTRLHHARQLLSTTRLSIAEVAERVGFSSGEYLCVAFKKQGWPSPKTFRTVRTRQETSRLTFFPPPERAACSPRRRR
ncbi:XylR family transcriptional regulator [Prosthecobacter sp.]|uniref:XylR family transcriptional regulator n=1 Tax=Prosthecobacter sp. TaxID=1965333 RepID=UPI0037834D36